MFVVSVLWHLPSSLLPTAVLDADIKHHTDVAISLWESALVARGLA